MPLTPPPSSTRSVSTRRSVARPARRMAVRAAVPGTREPPAAVAAAVDARLARVDNRCVTVLATLLERDAQLAVLAEYAADARVGRGRLVLVRGEAGIGKSALLEAFEDRLAD